MKTKTELSKTSSKTPFYQRRGSVLKSVMTPQKNMIGCQAFSFQQEGGFSCTKAETDKMPEKEPEVRWNLFFCYFNNTRK